MGTGGTISPMLQPIVIVFVLLGIVFATTHALAVSLSIYWYLGWFDSVMHFWGGFMVTLGLFAVATFSRFRTRPTFLFTVAALLVFTLTWEGFELWAGLVDPDPRVHLLDSTKDVLLGISGGLIMYALFRRFKI